MASVEQALTAAAKAATGSGSATIASEKKLRKGATSDVTPRDRIAEEYYDAVTVGDITSVKIPIVYGQVFHKGVSVDSGLARNSEADRFNDRTIRFIMSEGPCEGVVDPHKYHIVLDQAPVVNPVNQETIMAGVKVKDITTRTTYTNKTTDESYDYQNTVLDTVTAKIHRSLLKNSVAGLDDVAIDQKLNNRHILHFDSLADRWVSSHISEAMKETGIYLSEDVSPSVTAFPQAGWHMPASAGLLTITFEDNAAYDHRTTGDGPHRWWREHNHSTYEQTQAEESTDDVVEQAVRSLKVNGIKHPDLTVHRGGSYVIDVDSTKWLSTFDVSSVTYNHKICLATVPQGPGTSGTTPFDPEDSETYNGDPYPIWTKNMQNGTVVDIKISADGSGYTAGDSPTVTISAPSSGTTAEATIVWDGYDWYWTITNPGEGYEDAPTISFSGGSGSGLTATTKVSANYADATHNIIWTVSSSTPDYLWYVSNYTSTGSTLDYRNSLYYRGSRVWVRDS